MSAPPGMGGKQRVSVADELLQAEGFALPAVHTEVIALR